jgi:hypothetical protein
MAFGSLPLAPRKIGAPDLIGNGQLQVQLDRPAGPTAIQQTRMLEKRDWRAKLSSVETRSADDSGSQVYHVEIRILKVGAVSLEVLRGDRAVHWASRLPAVLGTLEKKAGRHEVKRRDRNGNKERE